MAAVAGALMVVGCGGGADAPSPVGNDSGSAGSGGGAMLDAAGFPACDPDAGPMAAKPYGDSCQVDGDGSRLELCDTWLMTWPADAEPASKCTCDRADLVVVDPGGCEHVRYACALGAACQVWPSGAPGTVTQ